MPTAPAQRLRHIDALRGIAALLVLWMHVAERYVTLGGGHAIGGRWLFESAQAVDVGRIGVVAFFLISGFVIPYSIRPDRPAAIGTFLVKRLFRIYPAYWLSVPLGALTTYWIWGRPFGAVDFALNLTLLQDLFGARPAEGLYWTLLVELVFYGLCVGLLLARSLDRPRRLCVLAIVLGFVHSLAMLMRWLDAPVLDSSLAFWCLNLSFMLCGALYRGCVVEGAARHDRVLRLGMYGLLAYYLIVFPVATASAIGLERNAAISYALGLLLFIGGVSGVRVATRLGDFLGRISYSLYLFHPVVFQALLWWLLRQPEGAWWRSQHLGAYLLVNAVLTIALAALIHRWIEAPGIRLGQQCAARWARWRARSSGMDAAQVHRRDEPAPSAA
jgi:peptidoglycan/LPS O-acetylase OafA/YrhL